MRKIIFALFLLAIIVPSMAELDLNQTIYLNGFSDGYQLGVLAVMARGNTTAAEEYNTLIQQYNDQLNATLTPEDAKLQWLAFVPMPDFSWYPEVLKQPFSDPWE